MVFFKGFFSSAYFWLTFFFSILRRGGGLLSGLGLGLLLSLASLLKVGVNQVGDIAVVLLGASSLGEKIGVAKGASDLLEVVTAELANDAGHKRFEVYFITF